MVVWSVGFEARDLANLRFAVSPFDHLAIGVSSNYPRGQRWWHRVRRHAPASAGPLLELFTAHPWYVPGFLAQPMPLSSVSGTSGSQAIDDELDAALAADPGELDYDLSQFEQLTKVPRIVQALRGGDAWAMAGLVEATRALFRACLADDWPDIHRRLQADVAHRSMLTSSGGLGSMLPTLHPMWHTPELLRVEYNGSRAARMMPDTEYDLGGRGALLTPNMFLTRELAPSVNPYKQPSFIYPALRGLASADVPTVHGNSTLSTLIGRGRAAALRAVGMGCTTAELAQRLGVSPPTASVHARTLRAAGLIATVRDGRSVRHSVTTLGAEMLQA
jgi:DNA-binding transcriptional ArsR family regulator